MRIWRELLEAARHAPSAHNAQPWRLRVLGELHSELLADAERMFPVTDPDGWETLVGLGCFVEALSIAASERGLEVRAALRGEPLWAREGLQPFARLVLAQRAEPEQLDPALLRGRRSSRLPYDGAPVPDDATAALVAAAAREGQRLTVSGDAGLVALVVELAARAQALPSPDPRVRAELASWIRLTESAARRRQDGLSARCLNASPSGLWLWFTLRGLVGLPGISSLAVRARARTMRGTASVVWLAGPGETADDWFRAGRALCRAWLTATAYGLWLHPLVSVLAAPTLRERVLPHLGGEEAGTWFLARIGTGPEPPRSLRLSVRDLLVDA